mgnify:CR=1 FL=1
MNYVRQCSVLFPLFMNRWLLFVVFGRLAWMWMLCAHVVIFLELMLVRRHAASCGAMSAGVWRHFGAIVAPFGGVVAVGA